MSKVFGKVTGIALDSLPKTLEFKELEARTHEKWQASGAFKFKPASAGGTGPVYAIDTPPPTVSGSLHVGHIFSYTQADILARVHRMQGYRVFYPIGWDDNGLPTERRVQNFFHIKCEPSEPYQPGLELPPILSTMTDKEITEKKIPQKPLSRKNFIDHCHRLTQEDEIQFKNVFSRIGLSVDWSLEYSTISNESQRIAQASFLDLVAKKHVYQVDAPTLWDCDFKTAVAQAELEDREIPGAFHDIDFIVEGADGSGHASTFTIATTRPELLPACVGVTAHPDDERYKGLFGKFAITPIFGARVPIFASEHVQKDKGTGILMVCTFGDQTDVQWWREQKLPLRQVVNREGRMAPIEFGTTTFPSIDPAKANEAYALILGRNVKQAQKLVVEMLQQNGSLKSPPKPIQHAVKFYEKGDRPVEILTSRQWFVRLLDKKQALLDAGEKIEWHPNYMKARYRNWTENLGIDWCISRQRFFGVSIPVWYPLLENGSTDFEHPIFPSMESLPVDPSSDVPTGYTESQRGKAGGFVGETDVFDTWFTSSMSPQVATGWMWNKEKHKELFPMSLRPQAHEIIRTWAFYTIAKAWLHEEKIPWKNIGISGWVLDPDRKKMSKSKGNVVTPIQYIDEYGADAVRYWAGLARLGSDTAFDPSIMKIGRRLAMKLFNASKFVLSRSAEAGEITNALDLAFIAKLKTQSMAAKKSMIAYEPAQALMETEKFFWSHFTDTYLELVKSRAWADEGSDPKGTASAVHALRLGLEVLVKGLAVFIPYTTDEVWSWAFADKSASVHTALLPDEADFEGIAAGDPSAFDAAVSLMSTINQQKTEAKVSVARPVVTVTIAANAETLKTVATVWTDVKATTKVDQVNWVTNADVPAGNFLISGIEYGPDEKRS